LKRFIRARNCPNFVASRLPMRNWNRTCSGMKSMSGRFQTTYEELKHFFISAARVCFSLASRLPMRNWNKSIAFSTSSSILLPDYLWGIETKHSDSALTPLLYRFQTTYEELKLRQSRISLELDICSFQTTYEELKPGVFGVMGVGATLPDYLWGIETGSDSRLRVLRIASRLPMRNWNLFHHRLIPVRRASRLPMRNWNWINRSFRYQRRCASRLPMRNWNRRFWIGHQI